MLFIHELHRVVGAREEAFEAAYRDGWMPLLGKGSDARLLYFLHHAHGTGASYRVITITAVRDGAAWEQLGERTRSGDLAQWMREVDQLRHDVTAKILIPLPWSPLQKLDLAEVPTTPAQHELTVFMEDTVWPNEGRLEEYIERSGSHYAEEMKQRGPRLLTVDAGFRTAFGTGRHDELILFQKLVEPRGLAPLVTREVPLEYRKPGTWMHDALELRDQWESKLLRTPCWSPCY